MRKRPMRRGIIFVMLLLANGATFAASSCEQPVSIVNVGNLACIDPDTGKIVHNTYRGSYELDIFTDDPKQEWYRGNFYGLDDD